MVLENASDPTADSFNDAGVPQSDRDPYATDSSPDPTALKVDASKWPKPLPVFGPLMGYTPKLLQTIIQRQVIVSTQVLGRNLDREEVEALGYWSAKSMSINSFGAPLGMVAGLYRTQATKSTYRFPFFTPDLERMNVNAFPSDKIKWFSGKAAQNAWHSMRGSAYAAVGYFVGSVIFSSYAASVCAIGEMKDPRLKALMEAITNRAKTARADRDPLPSQNSTQRPGEAKVWKGQTRNVDDASPTWGDAPDDSALAMRKEAVSMNDSMLTDEDLQKGGERRSALNNEQAKAYQANKIQGSSAQSNTDTFNDGLDDAFPAGGKGVQTTQSSGSAWERIRQQQQQRRGNPSTRSQQPNAWSRVQSSADRQQDGSAPADSLDSFGFSSSERNK